MVTPSFLLVTVWLPSAQVGVTRLVGEAFNLEKRSHT
jgi:hypothetical protein